MFALPASSAELNAHVFWSPRRLLTLCNHREIEQTDFCNSSTANFHHICTSLFCRNCTPEWSEAVVLFEPPSCPCRPWFENYSEKPDGCRNPRFVRLQRSSRILDQDIVVCCSSYSRRYFNCLIVRNRKLLDCSLRCQRG
jgi:hypothetical protein